MIGASVLFALSLVPVVDPRTALHDYVAAPDPSYHWEKSVYGNREALRMTAQTWHGHKWLHDLVLCRPKGRSSQKTWVLHVTGGVPNAFDVDWSQGLADTSGCPVAVLFQIPVQPLWDRKEDDLIAHTFEQYLESGDETWPLLLPMVKSAIRSMDAVQAFDRRAEKFVVFGASKRAWTSWLTAATGDKRVVGIAPMIFDNLKMGQQLAKQLKDWGEFSPMIRDYTSRNLEDTVESPEGQRLLQIVDPASYLDTIKVPVMAINGSNDPYWTTDASSLYWDDIKGPKWIVTVPNLGHAFEKTEWWTPSLAAFVKMCAGGTKLPMVSSKLNPPYVNTRTSEKGADQWMWTAESPTLNFSAATWVSHDDSAVVSALGGTSGLGYEIPQSKKNTARFVAFQFKRGGLVFWLTSQVMIFPKKEQ